MVGTQLVFPAAVAEASVVGAFRFFRCMKSFLHLLALLLLVPFAVEGRQVVMKADNAAVDLPREWKYELAPKLKATWGKVLLSAKAPDGKFVLVAVQDMSGADAAKAAAHLALLQEPALKEGWTVSRVRETLVDGMPFHSFTLTRKGQETPDLLLAATFTRDRVYTLQLGDPKGDVNEAVVLEEIWRSFRLLTPRTPLELQMLSPGEAPTKPLSMLPLKWVVGGVLGVVALIAVVQLFLMLQSKARRKRRRQRRAERMKGGKPDEPTTAEP